MANICSNCEAERPILMIGGSWFCEDCGWTLDLFNFDETILLTEPDLVDSDVL